MHQQTASNIAKRKHYTEALQISGRAPHRLGRRLFVQLDRLTFLILKLVLSHGKATNSNPAGLTLRRSFNLRSSFSGRPIGLLDTAGSRPSLASHQHSSRAGTSMMCLLSRAEPLPLPSSSQENYSGHSVKSWCSAAGLTGLRGAGPTSRTVRCCVFYVLRVAQAPKTGVLSSCTLVMSTNLAKMRQVNPALQSPAVD